MRIEILHQVFLKCNSVSTDTRKIQKGCLFVALRGDRFDANTFAEQALLLGAAYVIIDNPKYHFDDRTIVVEDSLQTLQQLANFHRIYLGLPIISLTGSNGKTTTKELIRSVLETKYNTVATVGNLNNHIGVPLTLLSFDEQTEIGIVEMGANHQKEIELLCNIAMPDFGYISNFGKAHLEGFGGVEGVIKGKSEMYSYLRENKKIAFVNSDDALQVEKSSGISTYSFGKNGNVKINSISADPFVTIKLDSLEIKSHLIGHYNASNICAAIAIARYFNIDDLEIKNALESYIPENNRSQMLSQNDNEIILDAYNANPSSMQVAIENFIALAKPNKILFLGDMFELGAESLDEHRQLVASLKGNPEVEVFFVGTDFYSVQQSESHFHFIKTFEDLQDYLSSRTIKNHTILIKGSRGMALERILDLI